MPIITKIMDENMNLEHQKARTEAEEDYENIFKPLIMTNGEFDAVKIKNEMLDLIFCTNQVSKVYMALTGNKLSKPMYYADVIISLHEDEIDEAYERGHKDGLEDSEFGWNPIETAPRDGTHILIVDENEVSEARYIEDHGWYLANNHPSDSCGPGQLYPTLWQPLPTSPENV